MSEGEQNNAGIVGTKIKNRGIKTVSNSYELAQAFKHAGMGLKDKLILGTAAAAVTATVAGYSLLNRNDGNTAPNTEPTTSHEPLINTAQKIENIQAHAQANEEDDILPFKYYSGVTTISLSNDIDFRKGPTAKDGNLNLIQDNKSIKKIGDMEIDDLPIVNGSPVVELTNIEFVKGIFKDRDTVFARVLSSVESATKNADGTVRIDERYLYFEPTIELQKAGLVKFSGGVVTNIENGQLEANKAGNGLPFGKTSLQR